MPRIHLAPPAGCQAVAAGATLDQRQVTQPPADPTHQDFKACSARRAPFPPWPCAGCELMTVWVPRAGVSGKPRRTGRGRRSPPAFHRLHITASRRADIQEIRPEMQAARTHDEVIVMTGTRRSRRPRFGGAMTAMRWSTGALRYVNDELTRASQAMIRSARFPQRPHAGAPGSGASIPAESAGTPRSLVQHAPAAERAARAA
jgi:hypothetical protein